MRLIYLLQGGLLQASVVLGQSYSITGVQQDVDFTTGSRPFRLNINDFQNSGPAFDLYVLALQNFTQVDELELTSYFQVAGIHGYPNVPGANGWDNVQGLPGDGVGYCTHGSVLFPTWHRPYMALFEQIIWEKAKSLAQQYPEPERAKYVAAAETLRVPYWDWSMQAAMPVAVSTPQITINTPKGQQAIDNPLYSYTFQSDSLQELPEGSLATTVRRPDDNGQSQIDLINEVLTNNAEGFHSGTYSLWTTQDSYVQFADAAWRNRLHFGTNSVEGIHNNIHAQVGGSGGQMADLSLAGFDPLFWLHHANVDRIFALWQALNPDLTVTPYPSNIGSFSTPGGTEEDETTPLYPFHSDSQGTLYTSITARSTKSFGYTYPEVIDWGTNSDPEVLKANVTAIINQMYNPDGNESRKRSRIMKRNKLSEGNAANYQWTINLSADMTLLEDTIYIYFFLSNPPSSAKLWPTHPSVISTIPILINPAMKMKPQSPGRMTSSNSVITHTLFPLINDLHPKVALPLLKNKLQWRATWVNGTVIDDAAMKGLKAVEVMLTGQTVEQTPSIHDFPIYGDIELHGRVMLGENGNKVL